MVKNCVTSSDFYSSFIFISKAIIQIFKNTLTPSTKNLSIIFYFSSLFSIEEKMTKNLGIKIISRVIPQILIYFKNIGFFSLKIYSINLTWPRTAYILLK